jgi:hypothetical protein
VLDLPKNPALVEDVQQILFTPESQGFGGREEAESWTAESLKRAAILKK